MENVRHYLDEFKPVAKTWFGDKRQAAVAADYEFFKQFSDRENLAKAEWPDFQKIGDHLNCFRKMALAKGNALGRPNHPVERYRESFLYLIYGDEPLLERVRKFRDDDDYRLDYFGDSAVSELVGYLFPETFIFFNARDQFAAKFLDIQPGFVNSDDYVNRLVKFAHATKLVADSYLDVVQRQTSLPLNLELDQFFSWLFESYAEAADSDDNFESRFWVIGASEDAVRWTEFDDQGIISIGWSKVGDLRQYHSQVDVLNALKQKYGENNENANPTNDAKTCFDFAYRVKIGDGVFVKRGRTKLLGFGKVTSEYIFDPNRPSHQHIRKVHWLKKGEFNLPTGVALSVKTLTPLSDADLLDSVKAAVGLTQGASPQNGSPAPSYWWLNANPKIWNFSAVGIGGKQTYTTHNEKGNKRQKYKYFLEAKPGDLMVGYVTNPNGAIVAICRITKGIHSRPDGESIEFEKIEQLNNPITLEDLNQNTSLKQSEPLANNHQGSLFRLTAEEYSIIRSMIEATPAGKQNAISFTVTDALKSLFLSPAQFQLMLDSLTEKKNIILQGPPGVGKTFIARRLADALTEEEESSRVEWIQFHQSYSYEDFIQGFRPTEGGHFELKNGIFYEFCRGARNDPNKRPWVFVIDEINRGNMSKIFGELMMLMEPDKRGKRFAMPLTYSKSHDEKFSVPENVHLIGLMNTADRSLSMVDYALRRRFRFITIEPAFESEKFKQHLRDRTADEHLIEKIVQRLNELNLQIASDEKNLGTGYQIGHSYFCPADGIHPDGNWYQRVVAFEIKPLLEEYWLDDQTKVTSLINRLLE